MSDEDTPLTFTCPTCDAAVGQPCKGKDSTFGSFTFQCDVPLTLYHSSRVDVAFRALAARVAALETRSP